MKQVRILFISLILILNWGFSFSQTIVRPSHPFIQITGRVDKSDPNSYAFAFPGVSIKATFEGTSIDAILREYGSGTATTTNYLNVIIDDGAPVVLQLRQSQTVYSLASGLAPGVHTVELFKRTESNVGKIAFKGFQLEQNKNLVEPAPLPTRKIEFIGNSITCGYGNEVSTTSPNNFHFTSVNENNYKAWGAVTARNINAQYSCVAFSGRGLYRNNTGALTGTLPLIYDQIIADNPTPAWNHFDYVPDVIVINLGTNDFSAEIGNVANTVDSATFVQTYVDFITKLRGYYPNANFICCVGTMMSDGYPTGGRHWTRIQNYVSSVRTYFNNNGDNKVFYLKLDPQLSPYGEDWHPTAATQNLMATALTNFINTNIDWDDCTASVNLGANINLKYVETPIEISSNSITNTDITYTWYKDDQLLPSETLPTLQISDTIGAAGTYRVVRDSIGCKYEDDIVLTNSLQSIGGVCNWLDNKKAAVVLTFDDWSNGHPNIVVPELKQRNMVGTFYIYPDIISNWTKIQEATLYGNEIGNHTQTHPNLTTVTPAELVNEIRYPDSVINANVPSQHITTFDYPFGAFNQTVIDTLKAMNYVGARGVWGISNYTYNFATTENNYYNINAFGLTTTTSIQTFANELPKVIQGGGLLTYLYHSVNSPTVIDNNYAAVPKSEFEHQLDTINSYRNKLWITTFSQALTYHREARCATVTQIQAPKNGTWVIEITDTLSNNSLYNQPLSIALPMNYVPYDMIQQNGNIIPIDSIFNDTILFKVIPDNGEIHLSISGIDVQSDLTPSVFTNTNQTNINIELTPTSSNGIQSVVADFSELGGDADTVLTDLGTGIYSLTYTVNAGLSVGYKRINFTITDNTNNVHIKTLGVQVTSGIEIQSIVVTETADSVTFTVAATDDEAIQSVFANITTSQGIQTVELNSQTSDTYSITFPREDFTGSSTNCSFTITDNSDNIVNEYKLVTFHIFASIEETETEKNIQLYPNPCKDILTIQANDTEILGVTISNSNGVTCNQISNSGSKATVDVRNLSVGIYVVSIETTKGKVDTLLSVE